MSLAFAPSFPLPFSVLPVFCSLSPFLSLLSLSLSYVTLGCCAWSFWPQTGPDFQRHPHFPLSFLRFPSLARPSHFSSFNIVPVWYFWPQTGQGCHSAGSSLSFQLSTVSGRRLVQGLLRCNSDSWNSLLDSKQSRPGSNLTPMHSSMTFWRHWVCIYGNLTPCGSTLWVRVKRHAIHHCGSFMHRRLVENILLIVINLCTVSQY